MADADARVTSKQERAVRRINQRFWLLAGLALLVLVISPLLFWLFEHERNADVEEVPSSYLWLVRTLIEVHRPAVLMVTHDVEEALLLADRVLVMADGGIVHDEVVALPRPRRRDHPDIVRRRAHLLSLLGVDEGALAPAQ